MISTSANFTTKMMSNDRVLDSYVVIDGTTYDSSKIIDWTFHDTVSFSEEFELGTTIANSFEVNLMNVTGSFENLSVNPFVGIDIGGSKEYVPLGQFIVDNVEINNISATQKNIKLICFDKMMKLDVPFTWTGGATDTIANVVTRISTITGVPKIGTYPTTAIKQIPNLYSCRQVLGFISALMGGNGTIDRSGNIAVKKFISTSTTVLTIDGNHYFENGLERGNTIYTIGQIVGDDGNGNVYTNGSVTASTMSIKIKNPFLTQALVDSIGTSLNGLSYIPFKMDWIGNPALESGDNIRIDEYQVSPFNTVLMDSTITYPNFGMSSETKTEGKTTNDQIIPDENHIIEDKIIDVNVQLATKENSITKSNTAPASPVTNQIWIDTSIVPAVWKRYTGSIWEKIVRTDMGELTGSISASQITTSVITTVGVDATAIKTGTLSADRIGSGSIVANKLYIGDYTNLITTDEKVLETVIDTQNLIVDGYIKKANPSFTNLFLSTMLPVSFKTGDELVFKGDVISPTATTGRFGIRYYDSAKVFISTNNSIIFNINTTLTTTQADLILNVPSNAVYYQITFIDNGITKYDIGVKNATTRKKHAGEMIIDGSITTQKISTVGLDAQIIKTGTMSFDRAQGGTVALGGIGSERGQLSLLSKDAGGVEEVAGFFGTDDQGNAVMSTTELVADTIISPSIMTKQYDGHALFNQDKNTLEIFINCHFDPDTYVGTQPKGSRENPFTNIQDGFDAIPDKLNTGANIWIHAGIYTEDVTLSGIQGNGFIRVRCYTEKVRYIKVWTNGNTVNTGTHINEVTAYNNNWYDGSPTVNVAQGKTVTGGGTTWSLLTKATDGVSSNNTTGEYANSTSVGLSWLQVDLGTIQDYLSFTRVYYYHGDRRKYNATKVEVSDNGTTWRTTWDSAKCGTFISSSAGWNHMPNIIGKFTISNISASIIFQDLRFYGAEMTDVLEMRNAFMPEFYYCHFFGNANTTYLIRNYASSSYFLNCEVNTADTYLLYSANGGNMALNVVRGGDCPTAIGVRNGGTVVGIGQAPKGITSDISTYTGGEVRLSNPASGSLHETGSYTVWQIPTDPAPTPPPAPTYATVEVSATSSGSYRNSVYVGWRTDNNYVYQGQWSGNGMHEGLWFWNTGLDFLSGKTITKLEIYCSRRSEGGNSGASTFYFRPHTYKTKPAGDPAFIGSSVSSTFKWGESKWVNITALASSFTSSGAKGIGIYQNDSSTSRYGQFNTTAKIRVTYQK